jgi:hypothetical protein
MDFMNTIYTLLLAVGLWMAFGSLQQLRDAKNKDGCCTTGDGCGLGFFDNITYWTVMLLAVSFTAMLLYAGYDEFERRGGVAAAKAAIGR